jgi:predicted nucleotidyltransferase
MEEALNALLQALQRYRPQRIILFGSAVCGEADAESALDGLVVKDTPEPFVKRLELMAELCPPGARADILMYRPSKFQRVVEDGNPFVLRAIEDILASLPCLSNPTPRR